MVLSQPPSSTPSIFMAIQLHCQRLLFPAANRFSSFPPCRLQPYGHVRSIFSGFPLQDVNKMHTENPQPSSHLSAQDDPIVEILFSQLDSFIFIFFVALGCE